MLILILLCLHLDTRSGLSHFDASSRGGWVLPIPSDYRVRIRTGLSDLSPESWPSEPDIAHLMSSEGQSGKPL